MKPVATLINSLLTLACSGAVALLAAHHPLSPLLALAACAAVAALVFIRLAWWPLAVLGLLPLAGLMPWTGWITVEEFDLVVLSAAAGGYARLVVSAQLRPPMRDFWRVVLLCLPFITSTLISLHIGVADAGGLTWGWWQGYVEPLNALRLAKPLFEVLLLLPLWLAARDADQAHAELMLERGMLCLLAGVVAGVLWERVSFTGLLNFSADYRATGPFWEMHVGGAALDAALVMAIPFAAVALTQARQPLRWLVLGAVCAGALYAALVTFSRIVYAAVPASLLLGLWLRSRAGGPGNTARWSLRLWATGALALLVFAAVAAWAFGSGGYRGLFMAWSIAALTGLVWRLPFGRAQWPWLLTLGALLLAWAVVVATVLPAQRPTLVGFFPLLLVAAPVITLAALGRLTPLWAWCAYATLLATWATALRWGTAVAMASSLCVLLGTWFGAIFVVARRLPGAAAGPSQTLHPVRPLNWPALALWSAASLATAAVVGVFLAGGYMGQRLSETGQDSLGRQSHWQHALSLLRGGVDWTFGKGLGRYHAHHGLSGRIEDQSGDYRLIKTDQGQSLVLTSGKHAFGARGVFRVSQRLAMPAQVMQSPPTPLMLRMLYRSDEPVQIRAELCEKHLLYSGSCLEGNLETAATGGHWVAVQIPMQGRRAFDHAGLVRPLVAFSMGLDSTGSRAEFDQLSLSAQGGPELLANGDFEAGLARWFTTSDRDHLPWHAKNQMLHLVFEQGVFGLASFVLLLTAATQRLWRATAQGQARAATHAATLAAALAGMLTVGLVDSLFDMPRATFQALLLLMMALALPRALKTAAVAPPTPPARAAPGPAKV